MKINLDSREIDLTATGKGYTVSIDGQTFPVEILRAEAGQITIKLPATESAPGSEFNAYVSSNGTKRWVTVNGQTFQLNKINNAPKRGAHGHQHHNAGQLLAPMPGQIRAVQVEKGARVTKGQTLIVLEAMKMEIKIAAPFEGVVKILNARPGETVDKEQLLAEITPDS